MQNETDACVIDESDSRRSSDLFCPAAAREIRTQISKKLFLSMDVSFC